MMVRICVFSFSFYSNETISFYRHSAAIHDYQSALEVDEGIQRAKEGLEKAKSRQKQAERRDYYKILGVSRKATKREIVKAYRKGEDLLFVLIYTSHLFKSTAGFVIN